MRSVLRQPTAEVLSNRGVPIKVHEMSEGRRAEGVDGKPVFVDAIVRMDAYLLACIEDKYEGMEGLQRALEDKPNRTLIDVLAMVWETDPQTAGRMMVDGKQDDYATALTVSLLVANGAGGAEALKVLNAGVSAGDDKARQIREAVEEMVAEEVEKQTPKKASTPGPNGSGVGSKRAAVLTTSGS